MDIYRNGHVVTMNKKQPYAQSVVVEGNKILKVGTNEEISGMYPHAEHVYDLGGCTLLPGFNDSYMHLTNFAQSLEMIPLGQCRTIQEIVDEGKKYLDKNLQHRGWLKGRGWNQDYFQEPVFPCKEDLDQITTEIPLYFVRACGHVLVTNTKALEQLGITKETPQIEGGHFDVDEEGNPTGVFREAALYMVLDHVGVPSVIDIKRHILRGCKEALEAGITSIQTDDFETYADKDYKKVLQAYRELEEEGLLPLRIYQQCLLKSQKALETFLDQGYQTGQGTEFFKIGPLKLLADGSLGARTAYLQEPYKDDPLAQGIAVYSQKELEEIIDFANDHHMQIAIHCIGDGMLERAISGLEKQGDIKDRRHGIVHCQISSKEQLKRMGQEGIMAYVQPIFLDYDHKIVESRVGSKRARESYNFKTMTQVGIKTPYSSDCPVETLNVMKGIYSAVTRQGLDGTPNGGWLPDQRVTLEEALCHYTLDGAYASFEEDIKGSIEEGKLADMVLLDCRVDTISKEELKNVQVKMTMVGGKIRYSNIGE